MDVGLIGLGHMGTAMAGRLVSAGHDLRIWNRDLAKAKALVEQGAVLTAQPADTARAGVVVTMLADDRALERVAFDDDGIVGAGERILHISCSTVSVELTSRLAEAHARAGQQFVSAQVLGRPDVAAAGKLVILSAGDPDACAQAKPVLETIGSRTIWIGAVPAMAAATKLAANFGIATLIEMMSEQMRIAAQNGIEPARLAEILDEVNFGGRYVSVYGPIIADQQFEPAAMPARLGRKDVGLAIDAALGARLPFAELLAQRLDLMIDNGQGELDWAALGQEHEFGL